MNVYLLLVIIIRYLQFTLPISISIQPIWLWFSDAVKEETVELGGIELLVALLRRADMAPEALRNICGCLKNLAFGRANDANKRRISRAGGIKLLAQLLRSTTVVAVHEEARVESIIGFGEGQRRGGRSQFITVMYRQIPGLHNFLIF